MPKRLSAKDVTYPTDINTPRGVTRAFNKWLILNREPSNSRIQALNDDGSKNSNFTISNATGNLTGITYHKGGIYTSASQSSQLQRHELTTLTQETSKYHVPNAAGMDIQGSKLRIISSTITQTWTDVFAPTDTYSFTKVLIPDHDEWIITSQRTEGSVQKEVFQRLSATGAKVGSPADLFASETSGEIVLCGTFDGQYIKVIAKSGSGSGNLWGYTYTLPDENGTSAVGNAVNLGSASGVTPSGMAYLNGIIYVTFTEGVTKKIRAYTSSFARLSSEDIDLDNSESVSGLTTDGEYLYVMYNSNNRIRAYHPFSKTHAVEKDITIPTRIPNLLEGALAYKKGVMYLLTPNGIPINPRTFKLYQIIVDPHDYVDEPYFNTPFVINRSDQNKRIRGFSHNDQQFLGWIENQTYNTFNRYGGSGSIVNLPSVFPAGLIGGNTVTRGFEFDGVNFWQLRCNNITDQLMRHAVSGGTAYELKTLPTRPEITETTTTIIPTVGTYSTLNINRIWHIANDGTTFYMMQNLGTNMYTTPMANPGTITTTAMNYNAAPRESTQTYEANQNAVLGLCYNGTDLVSVGSWRIHDSVGTNITGRGFRVFNTNGVLQSQHTTLNTGNTNPQGITFWNNRYYVLDRNDSGRDRVYVYNASFSFIERFNLPQTASLPADTGVSPTNIPTGITNDGNYLYILSTDASRVIVFERDSNGNYNEVNSRNFAIQARSSPLTSGHYGEGLTFHNGTMYIIYTNFTANTMSYIYPYNFTTTESKTNLDDTDGLQDLTKYNGKLWVLDNTRHNLLPYEDTISGSNAAGTGITLDANTNYKSVTSDENYLYVLGDDNVVYAYDGKLATPAPVTSRNISIPFSEITDGTAYEDHQIRHILIWDNVMYALASEDTASEELLIPISYRENNYLGKPTYPNEFEYVETPHAGTPRVIQNIQPQPVGVAYNDNKWYYVVVRGGRANLIQRNDDSGLTRVDGTNIGGSGLSSSIVPHGLTWGNNELILASSTGFIPINPATGFTISGGTSYASGTTGANVRGITFGNGTYYLVTTDGEIHRYSANRQTLLGTYDIATTNPDGISYYDGHLYIIDGTADHVYVYDTAHHRRVTAREFALTGSSGVARPAIPGGVVFKDHTMWVIGLDSMGNANAQLYPYEIKERTYSVLPITEHDIVDGGIATNGTYLFVVSGATNNKKIFKINRLTGKVVNGTGWNLLTTAAQPGDAVNGDPTGIVWREDIGKLVVLDATSKHLFVYDDDAQDDSPDTLQLPNNLVNATGIAWLNDQYWIVAGNNLYAFDSADLTTLPTSIAVGGTTSHTDGLATDGTTLYVLLNPTSTKSILAFDKDGNRQYHLDIIFSQLTALNGIHYAAGLTYNNGVLYILDGGNNSNSKNSRVFQIQIRKFPNLIGTSFTILDNNNLTNRNDLTLHVDNTDPRDIASDGTTNYVLDQANQHIYAYDVAAGYHKELSSFDLAGDNQEATSIAIKDEKLYCLNATSPSTTANPPKIFVYDLNVDRTRVVHGDHRRLSFLDFNLRVTEEQTISGGGFTHIGFAYGLLFVSGKSFVYYYDGKDYSGRISFSTPAFGFHNDRIYRLHNGDIVRSPLGLTSTNTRTSLSTTSLGRPEGLASFNGALIAVDRTTDKIIAENGTTPFSQFTGSGTPIHVQTSNIGSPETLTPTITLDTFAAARGCTADRDHMWVLISRNNNREATVYQYPIINNSVATTEEGSFTISLETNEEVYGLTKNDTHFFILSNRRIYRYTLEGQATNDNIALRQTYQEPNGIAHMGGKLYAIDSTNFPDSVDVFVYSATSGQYLPDDHLYTNTRAGGTIENDNYTGITAVDGYLYMLIHTYGIRRHHLSSGDSDLSVLSSVYNTITIEGLTYSGDYLYVLEEQSKTTIRFRRSALRTSNYKTDNEITLDSNNSAPYGVAVVDDYIYVGDRDNTVYAYQGTESTADYPHQIDREINYTGVAGMRNIAGMTSIPPDVYLLSSYASSISGSNKLFAWNASPSRIVNFIIKYAVPNLKEFIIRHVVKREQFWSYSSRNIVSRSGINTMQGVTRFGNYILTCSRHNPDFNLRRYNLDLSEVSVNNINITGARTSDGFFDNTFVRGITTDGRFIYLCTSGAVPHSYIFKVSVTGNSGTVVASHNIPSTHIPQGIVWYKGDIYFLGKRSATLANITNVLKISDDLTGSTTTVATIDHDLVGIERSEGNWYVVKNDGTKAIIVYDADWNQIFTTNLNANNQRPTGIYHQNYEYDAETHFDRLIVSDTGGINSANRGFYLYDYHLPRMGDLNIKYNVVSQVIDNIYLSLKYNIAHIVLTPVDFISKFNIAKIPLDNIYFRIKYGLNHLPREQVFRVKFGIAHTVIPPINLIIKYAIASFPLPPKDFSIKYAIDHIKRMGDLIIKYDLAYAGREGLLKVKYGIEHLARSITHTIKYNLLNRTFRLSALDITIPNDSRLRPTRGLTYRRGLWYILSGSGLYSIDGNTITRIANYSRSNDEPQGVTYVEHLDRFFVLVTADGSPTQTEVHQYSLARDGVTWQYEAEWNTSNITDVDTPRGIAYNSKTVDGVQYYVIDRNYTWTNELNTEITTPYIHMYESDGAVSENFYGFEGDNIAPTGIAVNEDLIFFVDNNAEVIRAIDKATLTIQERPDADLNKIIPLDPENDRPQGLHAIGSVVYCVQNPRNDPAERKIFAYNSEGGVTDTVFFMKYSIAKLAEQTLNIKYHIFELRQQVLNLKYEIANIPRMSDLITKYNVAAAELGSIYFRVKYNIDHIVLPPVDFILKYAVDHIVLPPKDLIMKYAIGIHRVEQFFSTKYNIAHIVLSPINFILKYAINSIPRQTDFNLKYTINQIIHNTIAVKYLIRSDALEKLLAVKYAINPIPRLKDFITKYAINETPIAQTFNVKYWIDADRVANYLGIKYFVNRFRRRQTIRFRASEDQVIDLISDE